MELSKTLQHKSSSYQITRNELIIMLNFATYIKLHSESQIDSVQELEDCDLDCKHYIKSLGGNIIKEFKDIDTNKNFSLQNAIEFCKVQKCTLVIAKLDRLAMNVEFISLVIYTGIDIYFCDMPNVNQNTLRLFAPIAQYMQKIKSEETINGLNIRKAQGKEIGGTKTLWCKNSNLTDHEKELYRSELGSKGGKEAGANRRQNALSNTNNTAFKYFIEDWVKIHGEVNKLTKWAEMVQEMNIRGMTTATGMEYNEARARSMHHKITKIYK